MITQCRQSVMPEPFWKSNSKLGVTLTSPAPEVTPEVVRMLRVLDRDMNRSEIIAVLGLSDEKYFREHCQQSEISMELPAAPAEWINSSAEVRSALAKLLQAT